MKPFTREEIETSLKTLERNYKMKRELCLESIRDDIRELHIQEAELLEKRMSSLEAMLEQLP